LATHKIPIAQNPADKYAPYTNLANQIKIIHEATNEEELKQEEDPVAGIE